MIMQTIRVHDLLPEMILVSRESARLLERSIHEMRRTIDSDSDSGLQIVVDFVGVAGIAPSFMDELVRVFEGAVGADRARSAWSLVIANPPTRLSSKFEAVARGHAMSIQALPDGSWILSHCDEKRS